MYQRLGLVDVVAVTVSFILVEPSGSNAEYKGDGNADQLVREQEKNRSHRDHDKYHGGRNRGFRGEQGGAHIAVFPPRLYNWLAPAFTSASYVGVRTRPRVMVELAC